jgi:hypothetical protein
MEPFLKLGTAASWRKHDESLADFTNRDSAEKQRRETEMLQVVI